MSLKSKIKAIKLNKGEMEAERYAYKFKVFQPEDLENDRVISELFKDYIESAKKGNKNGPFFFTKNNQKYNGAFRNHLAGTYRLHDAQLDRDAPFTPEQIAKFRQRLTRHLSEAYNRIATDNIRLNAYISLEDMALMTPFGRDMSGTITALDSAKRVKAYIHSGR